MLLQQFGLGVVRRPAGPGNMEPALTRRVCFSEGVFPAGQPPVLAGLLREVGASR
jgi:hypothetical protein